MTPLDLPYASPAAEGGVLLLRRVRAAVAAVAILWVGVAATSETYYLRQGLVDWRTLTIAGLPTMILLAAAVALPVGRGRGGPTACGSPSRS